MFIKKKNLFEDDVSLWNSFINGNDDAYCHIYEKYAKRLFIQGLQFIPDRELVKDCIHDVFVKIYSNRTKLSSTDNIKMYLFIALKNTLINELRKRKIYFDILDENVEYGMTDNNSGEFLLINKETERVNQYKVDNILSKLTTRQREVIYYRFIECMSMDEICSLMDMNYQSVQNLLQRSVKKIRESQK